MGQTATGHVPKNLVVCCDGTGKAFGDENTNVVALFDAIHKDDLFSAVRKQRDGELAQVAFYDPGVGSLAPEARFSLRGRLGMALSKAFGLGFRKNILDGYRFLMTNYQDGDRVFLFGFSRGAFTVRWLAGVLHKVGLLHRGNENLLDYAMQMALAPGNAAVADGFKRTFSRSCDPHVMGVWDTVSSLGVLSGKTFPDLVLNPGVRHAFHALSIDERRGKFPPQPWDEAHRAEHQEILQVWFAGDHSDVGGGHTRDRGLSFVTLSWMLEHARRCGLVVREDALAAIREYEEPLAPAHDLYRGAWRLLGSAVRAVPEGARLHATVVDRMRAQPDYRPPALPPGPDELEHHYAITGTPRSALEREHTLHPTPAAAPGAMPPSKHSEVPAERKQGSI